MAEEENVVVDEGDVIADEDDEDLAMLTSSNHSSPGHVKEGLQRLHDISSEQQIRLREAQEVIETLRAEKEASEAELRAEIAKLSRSVKIKTDELEFFQQQYGVASNAALAEVRKSEALAEENDRLKSQLDLGLKQKGLHFDAIKQKLESENRKIKMENAFLVEQSRLTDDKIRKDVPVLRRRIAEVRVENEMMLDTIRRLELEKLGLEERMSKFEARNESLSGQVADLRAGRMGVYGDRDGNFNADDMDSEDYQDNSDNDVFLGDRHSRHSVPAADSPELSVDPVNETHTFDSEERAKDRFLACKWGTDCRVIVQAGPVRSFDSE